MTTRKQGEIIFWNGEYGFIEVDFTEKSIFFHASQVNDEYADVQLLDHVSFKVGKSTNPRHLGEPVAYRIKFIERGDYAKYRRVVGQLKGWNGRFGYIYSEQLDKATLFYHTRLARGNHALNDGDYLVFSPVKSSKNPDDQFAFFAYPFHTELDNQFLLALWKDSSLSAVGEVIILKNRQEEFLSFPQRFEIELELLLNLREDYPYTPIKALIDSYKRNFTPEYERLKLFLPEEILIQLWEDEVIDTYNLEQLKSYFYRASAPTKRAIISRFTTEDQEAVLEYFFDRLMRKGSFERTNNDLKTFLDLICRNPETEQLALLERAEVSLYQHLAPTDIIELWLKGYINTPPLTFLQENLSINDLNRWQDPDGKLTSHLQKIVEDYFANLRFHLNFEEAYDQIVIALRFLKSVDEPLFKKWLHAVNTQLQAGEKLILWLFFPESNFVPESYLSENGQQIDPFWVMNYLLVAVAEKRVIPPELVQNMENLIAEDQLLESAKKFKWNRIVKPVAKGDDFSFLAQTKAYLQQNAREDIKLESIGVFLFEHLPAYRVEHVRMWIYAYVPKGFLKYQEFRQLFKHLTREEQKSYQGGVTGWKKEEVITTEREAVTPCANFMKDVQRNIKTYQVRVNNIHFTSYKWALRIEDGTYTTSVENDKSDVTFNSIPVNSTLGEMEFRIQVEGDKVLNEDALNKLFEKVHSDEIAKALKDEAINMEGEKTTPSAVAYPEDWHARKQSIAYLQAQQLKGESPIILEEAKAPYRRLNEDTPSEDIVLETTQLFTLDAGEDYLIVWENTDLSEDRATFLFKTTPENYLDQMDKLVEYITTQAHLRSAIVSRKDDGHVQILRHHLGFVGKILKARGNHEAFDKWREKLEAYFYVPTPSLPEQEELDSLENWSLAPSVRIRRQSKKIEEEDLETRDVLMNELKESAKKPSVHSNRQYQREQILKSLQEINAILNP
ncbi:cold shock domain-containing protein [Lewinella cohaerens]|uniref:cold shock domain-containing protein n=1 Tax=Lewinella cohaerens TaxID=70995 RepID=UPI00035F2D5C|nr:cold shock domain-containing protein [Lewinella cohaerens]